MVGKEKIAILVAEKGQDLVKSLIPKFIDIGFKIGIENLGQENEKIPATCLSKKELNEILILRNKLMDILNNSYNTINLLVKPVDSLNSFINASSAALKTVDTTRKATNISLALLPPPLVPGATISLINNLKDIYDELFPKIKDTKNIVKAINISLDYVNSIVIKFIDLFKTIDTYLLGCGIKNNDLTSLNNILNILNNSQNNTNFNNLQTYNNFILEIVEEPFSPTVNRRKAIAKNSQGIILLQTPLSFTTENQILIEELKLIIDSNNLKAD